MSAADPLAVGELEILENARLSALQAAGKAELAYLEGSSDRGIADRLRAEWAAAAADYRSAKLAFEQHPNVTKYGAKAT